MKNTITLQDVLSSTQGKLVFEITPADFNSIGTDTRKNLDGQLFVALEGEAYDAHHFLKEAVAAGAKGLLVHHWDHQNETLKDEVLKRNISVILVENTLVALQQLAQYRRQQWGKTLIAITGSNGKTTTKEFCAQILSKFRKVHYNKGSFNNHWGLPLTLLELQNEHELAICEMGMNHLGEIASLVTLALPNVVGVTMVGRAHLEGLGSLAAVAQAKEEIYGTPNSQLQAAIFNLDNPWTKKMWEKRKDSPGKTLTYGHHPEAQVQLKVISMSLDSMTIEGRILSTTGTCQVPVFGLQNITNLMFAATVALSVGITPEQIWSALPLCQTSWGRNQKIVDPQSGALFLFDGYNANPDSQKALIENLKTLSKDRPLIGVFGEMRELGADSEKLHEELGNLVSEVNFKEILFVGTKGEAFKKGFHGNKNNLHLFQDITPELITLLKANLKDQPLISIKGSRGVRLERILKELDLIGREKDA